MLRLEGVCGRFGAWPAHDGLTRFRLWAPAAHEVWLVGEDIGELPMHREPDGSFSVVAHCSENMRYRYRVDDQTPVPDPASRWQPDGVHGASAVMPMHGHRWSEGNWRGRPWHEAVIYELHVGTCGGYAGVRAQLTRLAAMGITAIELMPVSQFPGERNWGYDGVFPYAPARAYGHPDELKSLIDEAHQLGLMVLLDVVYNHFGPDGNLLGRYAAPFFRHDTPTPWGEAIDFRQPTVQRFFIDNALMWLHEYRFDGLRLDAVHAITPNAFLETLHDALRSSIAPGRHVHLILENEHNQASQLERGYTAQWDDDFHNALHVLLTGEHEGYYAAFADDPLAHLVRVLGEGFAYQGQADPRGHMRGEPSAMLPPDKFVVFAQNHDQIGNRACGDRLRTLVDEGTLRAALALTALTPMIPMFFMGEPWGASQPFLFFTDFQPPLDEAVREGRRREFAHFSAFADPAKRQQIPDPNALQTFLDSVTPIGEAEVVPGDDWRAFFVALIAVRRRWLVERQSGWAALGARAIGPKALTAGWQGGPGSWYVAVNFADAPVALPGAGTPAVVVHPEPAQVLPAELAPRSCLAWCVPGPS